MSEMALTSAQLDRACGAVLGTAVGDALGAGYEFDMVRPGSEGPRMIGGGLGNFAPGEWTDDTTMAWAILDVAATGADLRSEEALTAIAGRFRDWYDSHPADIGTQTSSVLGRAGSSPTGVGMTTVASELHARTGRTAGNGSLMRTAPVTLAHLDSADACAEAARSVSALTHFDERAQEACVLWSLAIRHAILTGTMDVRAGLDFVDIDYWGERLVEAEVGPPSRFNPNGWAVSALQAAWSAIVAVGRRGSTREHGWSSASKPGCRHLPDALAEAIAIGNDTDTVVAIAGGLLGATYGASAVPAEWRRISHGYPGLTGEQLVELAHLAASGGPGAHGWPLVQHIDYSGYGVPVLVQHPHDDGVWLGNAAALDDLPDEITAVVSLCLVGSAQVPAGRVAVGFRLIDQAGPEANPNVDFVVADAARTVVALRDEGHRVLVHCVAGQSRTPTVGVAYSLLRGVPYDTAMREVCEALPAAHPIASFRKLLRRFAVEVGAGLTRPRPGQPLLFVPPSADEWNAMSQDEQEAWAERVLRQILPPGTE